MALASAWDMLEANGFSGAVDAFCAIASGKISDRSRAEALRGEGLALFALGKSDLSADAFIASMAASPADIESAVVRAFISKTLSLSDDDMKSLLSVDKLLSMKGMPVWSRRAGARGLLNSALMNSLDAKQAIAAAASLGAVTEWRSRTPFPNPSGGGLSTSFIDETGMPAFGIRVEDEAQGSVGPSGLVVPSEYFGGPVFSVYYAVGYFQAEESGSYWMVLDRTSAALKVWLDGALIIGDDRYASGEDSLWARVELSAGKHTVLVKSAAMGEQASFRLFVDKAVTSASSDLAATRAFESLVGEGRSSTDPVLGLMSALYRASPSFQSSIWLSTALTLAGYGDAAATVVGEREPSPDSPASYLAAWAEYRSMLSVDKYPEARAAMARIPFGAGFAPRDDADMMAAVRREAWAEAGKLSDASIAVTGPRLYADLIAAVAALGTKSDGFSAYNRFQKTYPGYGELAREVYMRGGLGMSQGTLLSDWAHGDYVSQARIAMFGDLMDGGLYPAAFALGSALLSLRPWDCAMDLNVAQAGYFSGAAKYEQYINALEAMIKARPGLSDPIEAAILVCSGVISSVERTAASGMALSDDGKWMRASEPDRLERLIGLYLAFDPSDFYLRERARGLDGKESIDARYSTFRPDELIVRFESSGVNPSGDAAIISDSDTRIYFDDAGMRRYRSLILKILSKAGLEAESTQFIQSLPGGSASLRRATVRKADGRAVEASVSGGRVNFVGLEVGDYIVMEYSADGSRKDYFDGDFWLDSPMVGYEYVFERDLRILYPAGKKPAYAIHGNASAVKVTESDAFEGYRETRFEVRAASAMRVDLPLADQRDSMTWVDVSTIADWSTIATWYRGLASGAALPTPAIRRLALSLVKGARDTDDAVRRLFEYASSSVTYEDLAFQYSAFVPEPAADVVAAGSGDCKDKAALLSALLSAAGIESRYALSEPSYTGLNAYLPSPRFSHVIILAKRGEAWLPLDPTGSTFTYPDIPSALVGTRILPIPASGEKPASALTVLEQPAGFGSVWTIELELDRSTTRAKALAVLRGDEAAELRSALSTDDETFRRSIVDAFAGSYLPGSAATTYSCDDERSLGRSPLLRVESSGPSSLAKQGTRYSVSLSWLYSMAEKLLFASRQTERSSPVSIGGNQLESPCRQTFILSLPDGFSLASLPRSETLSFGAATARFTCAQVGKRLIVEREYHFPSMAVKPEALAELRAFADKLRAKEAELVTLIALAE